MLLSLIASGEVQIVDEEFRPTGSILGLVAVERGLNSDKTSYRPDLKKGNVRVEGGGEYSFVDVAEIEHSAKTILDVLQHGTGSAGIPEVETLLAKLRVAKLAASSQNKADLRIVVQDSKTTSRLDLPMSIKSMIGSPPSLLNASGATNFEVRFSCNESLESELLLLGRKPKKIIQRLVQEQIPLELVGPVNQIFRSNLMITESAMPYLLAELLISYYAGSRSNLLELVDDLAIRDPLGFGEEDARRFYTSKVKTFLMDVALGMTPSIRWNGGYSASGGYLVVKSNGELVCLYAADRDNFRDYLYLNARLETGDTKKHGFGQVLPHPDGGLKILLNLQVRFKNTIG